MARQKREIGKTGVYHILLRGVNALFFDSVDYDKFISILKKHIDEGNIKVLSYLLLKNRVHLVIDANGEDIGKRLKPITTSYARYLNKTRASSGKLFYDRFRSEPIDSKKDLRAVVAFVNAIAVFASKDYFYSSYTNPISKDLSLTKEEQTSTDITEMFIEDYDCLSKNDLAKYINAFCGVSPKEYKGLTQNEQKEVLKKLTEKFWISKSKIYELLGIKKEPVTDSRRKTVKSENNTPKKKTEKASNEKPAEPKKKDLSVWLL